MTHIAAIITALLFLAPVTFAQRAKPFTNPTARCHGFVLERLSYYFSRQAIEAAQIINNSNDEPNRSRTETIKIGPHAVEWIVDTESRKSRVSLRINGDLVTLENKQSIHPVDGKRRLDMGVVGEWYQVKLYKLSDRDVIAITMGPAMCTGLMCSVGAQMYYDATSKRSEFFGRYRTDHEAQLYRFTGNESVYVISANFDGDSHLVTSPSIVTYNLYKLLPDGGFKIEKNFAGKEFFLRHTVFEEKRAKPDGLQVNWVEKLN